jgi:hypothetical protein
MGVGWIGVGGDAKEKKREKILCSNQERLIRAAVSHWEFAGLRWYPPPSWCIGIMNLQGNKEQDLGVQ